MNPNPHHVRSECYFWQKQGLLQSMRRFDQISRCQSCLLCRYAESEVESRVAAVMTSQGFQESTEGSPDSLVGIVLESTPFYAEQGGQVADTGRITSTSGLEYMEVQDTQVIPWLLGSQYQAAYFCGWLEWSTMHIQAQCFLL